MRLVLPEGREELLCENEPGCVHGFEATMTRGPISLVCAIAVNNSRSAANKLKKCGQQLKKCGQQLKKCGLVNNSRSAAWSTTQEFEMQPIVQEADREDYGPLWATTGHYEPLWAITSHYGPLRTTMGHYRSLRAITGHYGPLLAMCSCQATLTAMGVVKQITTP